MKHSKTLLLLAPVFFLFPTLFAQTPVSLELQRQRERVPFEIAPGENRIQLCGLIPGTTYSMVAVPAIPGLKIPLRLSLADPALDAPARRMSRADRPQHRLFVATAACMDFVLQAEFPSWSGTEPGFLSVGCTDCPEASVFLEKFMQQLEQLGMANLTISPGGTATTLVTNTLIGGNCFDVSNPTSTGPTNSRGTFANGTTNIGLAGGVVLATGNVASLPGPNNSANTSANTAGFNQNSANDGDLATLTGGDQWDVVRLEFDFKPTAETVQFDYVFGSEEYCEYVGTNYNDVFGFFISGPGISGNQNIALIPATTTPVAINNVNHQTNTAYYVNNNTNNPCQAVGACCSAECALDGWTTVLTATATGLIPCSTYHIKLAIADIADGLLFSAVFLKANSFEAGGQVKAEPVYPAGQNFVIEGCDNGFIKFIRGSGDVNVELTFNITITGTATPGLDYEQLATTFTIPAGQTEIQIPVSVYADLLAEGQETIIISLDNPCSCTQSQFTFLINDKPPLEIEMEDLELCGSSSTSLAPTLISSGQPPLTYNWNTGATSPSINITTPGTNTYTVTVTDHCGTTATASATVTLEPAPTAVLSGTGTFCAGVPGSVDLTIALTGVGPWEVVINNNGSNETQTFTSSPVTYTVNNPGNYSLVSVSTLNGCTGSATGSATLNEITVNLSAAANDPTCFNANNGSIQATATGGSGFTYSWNTGASAANLTGLGPGTYTVTATNSQGCTSEETVTLTEPPLLTATIAGSTNIDCNNPAGDADLEVGGGSPDYSYNWNNGSTVQDPTFNTGGTYSVTVTDDNNCTVTATVTITVNTTLPTAVAAPPGQITCTNTEITINGTGSSTGSQFYYAWSGPGIVCCETTLQPQVNAGGTYTLTVTNSENGCTNTVSVTVVENNTPPDVNINTPGSIGCTTPTLTLNGAGTSTGAGFTFTWSTVGGNFVCCTNTLTPQINQAGVYALAAVNNNNGCTAEASVTVSGNVDPPTATIAPPGVVDCNTPEIDLDASGSSQGGNFTYQWAAGGGGSIVGGGNTPNPTINQGGTYTITVTNTDNNCTATASVSVTASLTPPVAIATANGALTCQNPTLVLNGNGSSTGGNFTYEWTTPNGNIVSGANTLNPQVNAGGTYTLVVTNTTNGCTSSATVNVNSNVNQPQANAGPPLELNCLHPTLQLQGSGSTGAGFTVQWAANPGFILSGANTYSPTINEAGTYYLVVTNTANGCTNEDVVSVASNFDQPVASILPAGVIDCYSPQIDLDAGASTQGGNIQFGGQRQTVILSVGRRRPIRR
ncbi:MAG: choice-of-anchor L domain-containing protein [Saprospirales bacterium]|nr:choice-of-anchor L domain-containing protein [Saprospirales bacterium]